MINTGEIVNFVQVDLVVETPASAHRCLAIGIDSKVPKYKTLLDGYKKGSMIKERNRMDLM